MGRRNAVFLSLKLQIRGFELRISQKPRARELFRGDTKGFLELAGEMAGLFETKQKGDFLDRPLAVQQVAGFVQTQFIEPAAQFQAVNLVKMSLQLPMRNIQEESELLRSKLGYPG
jgi:hypothetical protein